MELVPAWVERVPMLVEEWVPVWILWCVLKWVPGCVLELVLESHLA